MTMHWIDPDSLIPVKSTVERFLFNPRGEADGMILANGVEAHFPPHLSKEVLAHLQAGERVTLYGVKPRSADMLACVAIETAEGARIDDTGSPPKAKKKSHGKKHRDSRHDELDTRPVEIVDTVQRVLHGPKGEVRGVLLTGGEIVRFPPHAAQAMPTLCEPGSQLAFRGTALQVEGATVIEAVELGGSKRTLQRIPKDPHKHP
jgi:hypothetical protein